MFSRKAMDGVGLAAEANLDDAGRYGSASVLFHRGNPPELMDPRYHVLHGKRIRVPAVKRCGAG